MNRRQLVARTMAVPNAQVVSRWLARKMIIKRSPIAIASGYLVAIAIPLTLVNRQPLSPLKRIKTPNSLTLLNRRVRKTL